MNKIKIKWIVYILIWWIWLISFLILIIKNPNIFKPNWWKIINYTWWVLEKNISWQISTYWFKNKILSWNNTWTRTSSWLVVNKKTLSISWITMTWIMVFIPDFLFNDSYLEFWKKYEKKYKIKVNFQTIEDMEKYKKIYLKYLLSWSSSFDLFIIPSDWIDLSLNNSFYKFIFKDDVQSFFVDFTKNIVNWDFTFIPVLLDPIVFLSKKNIKTDWKILTYQNLFSYFSSYKKISKLDIPILRSEDDVFLRFKENWKDVFFNYSSLYKNIILQKKISNSKDFIKKIDLLWTTWSLKLRYSQYRFLLSKVQWQNQHCKYFPWICLMKYWFVKSKFWYLSDLSIFKKYFDTKKFEWVIYNFPILSDIYNVRVWWFVVNKNIWTKKIYVKNFLQEYISEWIDGTINSWNILISPFLSKYSIKKYNILSEFEDLFSVELAW